MLSTSKSLEERQQPLRVRGARRRVDLAEDRAHRGRRSEAGRMSNSPPSMSTFIGRRRSRAARRAPAPAPRWRPRCASSRWAASSPPSSSAMVEDHGLRGAAHRRVVQRHVGKVADVGLEHSEQLRAGLHRGDAGVRIAAREEQDRRADVGAEVEDVARLQRQRRRVLAVAEDLLEHAQPGQVRDREPAPGPDGDPDRPAPVAQASVIAAARIRARPRRPGPSAPATRRPARTPACSCVPATRSSARNGRPAMDVSVGMARPYPRRAGSYRRRCYPGPRDRLIPWKG